MAILTLDDRVKPMNVVSPEWIAEMEAMIEVIASDPAVRGAVITSAKPSFMAGADLKHILAWCESGLTETDAFDYSQRASAMHRRLETCGKPFVAAINGLALGGGFELALACHARVLSDDRRAMVGLPEVSVGLLPGSGGTQRLARMIGVEPALDLLLSGASLEPERALAAGLVDELAPAEEVVERAARLIIEKRLSPERAWDTGEPVPPPPPKERALHPKYPAPHAIMAAVRDGVGLAFNAGLVIESRQFARLMTSSVARNIIRTRFVNKGLADKGARRPAGFAKFEPKVIGVIGAGLMGAGLAHVAARAGLTVRLLDIGEEAAMRGKQRVERALQKDLERKRISPDACAALLDRIAPGARFEALADCDLVIEAVFEDPGIKGEVLSKAQAAIRAEAVLASNTSTLPISELARAGPRPGRFLGLHFFSPVERMALVEIIRGAETSDETLAHAMDFTGKLRKTPIVVNDARGFYTSRVFQTFIHEGMALLQEGVAPQRIEDCAVSAGMPIGPLALLDEVTIELPMKIVRESEAALGTAYERPASYEVMRRMLDEFTRPGRKAGAGFYDYAANEKRLWAGLADAFPVAKSQPPDALIEQRLLYIQALETARCFEEGVLTSAADADLGSVLGWGFPDWTGGTLSLIDTVSADAFVEACDLLAKGCGKRFAVSDWLRDHALHGRSFSGVA